MLVVFKVSIHCNRFSSIYFLSFQRIFELFLLSFYQKLGVLDLLDEESRFPKGTDQSLLTKLHGSLHQNAFYIKPKVNNGKFGIKHYAGDVFYDVIGLLEKNRDTFRNDVLLVLKDSRLALCA